jgi:hypothetical protein
MLDLDQICERHAQGLGQTAQAWKTVVWSLDFQKISQGLSDGEVEALIQSSRSAEQLRLLGEFILTVMKGSGQSPQQVLQERSRAAGLSVKAWIQASNFEET